MMRVQYYSDDIVMNIGIAIFFIVFLMLFVLLIIFVWSLFISERKKHFMPSTSVIIPAYNEEANISDAIAAVLASNYDLSKVEVICVDDGSTDSTPKIIAELSAAHKNIRLISSKHAGKPSALNLGISRAKNDYIITLDADTVVSRDFIREILGPFSDRLVGAANGIALIKSPRSLVEHFQDVEYRLNNLIRRSFSRVFGNGIWFFGAAACFRRSALEKAGFFSNDVLTEDMDISLKMAGSGYKVLTVSDATYYTSPPATLTALFRQRMRWFYGSLQCTFKHISLFRRSFALSYLFLSQIFWALYSILAIPIIAYEVNYWMPQEASQIAYYLFRWFSFAGPVYVIYKIPLWGISFLSIFGVSAGMITIVLILAAFLMPRAKLTLSRLLVIFFYFPYTLLLNAVTVVALFRHSFGRKKGFVG